MIEVYASRLHPDKETYQTVERQTLLSWLTANGISAEARLDMLPMSLYLNGTRIVPGQWCKTEFSPTDHIEIYREPKGTDPFSITFALVFGAKAVLTALTPKIPSINANSQAQGDPLNEANAKGNAVKLNDIIPECAGYNPARYPDYAAPPRRYFASPYEQRIEMNLVVGRGRYLIPEIGVKVGATPMLSLGDDARFSIYEPGADMSGNPAHLHWYTAPEVGASSNGSAGLELTASSALTNQASATALSFNGDVVSVPAGAGSFPSDWTVGLLVQIAAPYTYNIEDGTGIDGRDVIRGNVEALGFVGGDLIEIQGVNAGVYVVHICNNTAGLQLSYYGTSGSPAVNGLALGDQVMAISFQGLRFRILATSTTVIQVERIRSTGSTDETWPGWPSMTSNQAQIKLDSSNLEGGYRGPFPACPEGELVTAIEFDLLYPSGLIFLGGKGERNPLSGYTQFEYRDMNGGGGWVAAQFTQSASTLDAVGYTHRINLPYPMRPECRHKKLIVNQGGNMDTEYFDTVMWLTLKGLMQSSTKTSYAGVTMLTADIRGGDRISSQTENKISVECTRILPVLRGGVWQAAQPTREISAWIGHMARDVGYSDINDVDIVELERLESAYWTPRGEVYDKIITDADTVKGCMIECLNAGLSELTIDRGVLVPVRDVPRGEVFDHVYNPQIMLDDLEINFSGPKLPDQYDGVDVEYYDHGTRQNEVVECRLPTDAGTRVSKMKLEGVTDRDRAWRWGMRERRKLIYRQRTFSFDTELDALNSAYGDYVALGVSIPGYGQSAEIETYAVQPDGAHLIGSTEPLDWTQPGTYKVVIRRRDGTASGPYIATFVSDYQFTIPALDFVPDLSGEKEPPIIQFGHESRWCHPALITSVKPRGTKSCAVEADVYDVRVYADDDNLAPVLS